MGNYWIFIKATYFTASIDIDGDGVITKAPPIIRRFINKKWYELHDYLSRKNKLIEWQSMEN